MDSKNTKLIVVKLDDESSPLMKEYVQKDDKTDKEDKQDKQDKEDFKPTLPLPNIVKPQSQSSNGVNFDELSFSSKVVSNSAPAPAPSPVPSPAPAPAPSPAPAPAPIHSSSQIVPFNRPKPLVQDFSLLAASREVKEDDKDKLPSFYNRPKPVPLPPLIKAKPKKVRIVPPFKNEIEDGYKIGFLPTVKQSDVLSKIPKKPMSLSKMETLLGIKAKITGR